MKRRDSLLADATVCEANRILFRRFFEHQEYKLRRQNHLPTLDDGCLRTLHAYITRLKNVNQWFANKPIAELTETDIRTVYDGLEDGTIKSRRGDRFKNRADYYTKVFKSKLFALAGKDVIAKNGIQYSLRNESAVRFVTESDVRKILPYVYSSHHRLLVWLAFDLGENINSLLRLEATDFYRESNPHIDRCHAA